MTNEPTLSGKAPRVLFAALWLLAALLVPARAGAARPSDVRQNEPPVTGAAVGAFYPLAAAGIPLEGPLPIDLNLRGAHSVRAADFNGDGRQDVVAAARDDGRIVWYHNDGGATPTFSARPVGVVPGAYLALPADVNRDGQIDILVIGVSVVAPSTAETGATATVPAETLGTGQVVWFENDGQAAPGFVLRSLATGLNYPVSAAVADLDGDGDPDVVVASRDDGTLRWFANNGAPVPAFASSQVIAGLDGAVSVDVGDIDHDGDPDLVSASENDDRIILHVNNGAATFSPIVIRPGSPVPDKDFAKSVRLADMEGDGDLDVLYASEGGNEIGWYVSSGGRTPTFTQVPLYHDANHAKFVTAADLDRDGAPDILWAASGDPAHGGQARVGWLRSNGALPPQFAPLIIQPAAPGARYVTAADLDGDGDLDVLTAARESGQIVWFNNRTIHRSALYPLANVNVLGIYKLARHVAAGDLDGDGDPDVVSLGQNDMIWYTNNGGSPPSFTPTPIRSQQYQGRWAEIVDMDRDGANDIVVASYENGRIFWYENNGARPPAFTERVMSTVARGPRAVLAADLDGDGDMDAYVASDIDNRIAWMENDGAHPPEFITHDIDTEASYPRSVYAFDMDADGDLDIVAASQGSDNVFFFENRGGAPLQWARRIIGQGDGAQHVHAADMDGDGDGDVVVASEGTTGAQPQNLIKVLINADGRGQSFTELIVDPSARQPHAVVTGDADGDGDQDIFAAIEGDNQIVWYENNGRNPPAFAKHLIYDKAFVAHGVNVADLDGDGDLDALAASRDSGAVIWAENLGGQYRFAEGAFALGPRAILTVNALHTGRAGDLALQMATLDVRFEDGAGNRLTTAQVAARVQSLSAYVESNGNARFDDGDLRLATQTDMTQATNGRILLSLTGGARPAAAPPGGAVTLYAVANLTAACGTQPLVMVARPAAPTAVDELAGDRLLAEGIRSLAGGEQAIPVDPPTNLRINEISANPSAEDDWLEIYNNGPIAVNMGGMFLSDDVKVPAKHQIPAGITIAPFSYLVFIADETPGPLHLNFRLSSSGETVLLSDVTSRQTRPLDTVTFAAQPSDQVAGRNPDGSKTWVILRAPTKGYANVRAGLDLPLFLPLIQKSAGC